MQKHFLSSKCETIRFAFCILTMSLKFISLHAIWKHRSFFLSNKSNSSELSNAIFYFCQYEHLKISSEMDNAETSNSLWFLVLIEVMVAVLAVIELQNYRKQIIRTWTKVSTLEINVHTAKVLMMIASFLFTLLMMFLKLRFANMILSFWPDSKDVFPLFKFGFSVFLCNVIFNVQLKSDSASLGSLGDLALAMCHQVVKSMLFHPTAAYRE